MPKVTEFQNFEAPEHPIKALIQKAERVGELMTVAVDAIRKHCEEEGQTQPSEPDAVAVLREMVEKENEISGGGMAEINHYHRIMERAKAVLSGQPLPNEWEEKYNALRNKAVAKNALLFQALKTVKHYAEGKYPSDQTEDILEVCDNALNLFTPLNPSENQEDRTVPEREFVEVLTALNRLVYCNRNSVKFSGFQNAVDAADEICQRYV